MRFATDTVVYCTELSYEQRTTHDPNAMDIGELAKSYRETFDSGHQQDEDYLERVLDMDSDDWQKYCDAYRADTEAHLDWLGKQGSYRGQGRSNGGGKGAPKGGKGGKGFSSGGGGDQKIICRWCNKPGHMKKDCRDLVAYKNKEDEERAAKGLPLFVPRRGVNELSVDGDYSQDSEPVYSGMLREHASLEVGCYSFEACGCRQGPCDEDLDEDFEICGVCEGESCSIDVLTNGDDETCGDEYERAEDVDDPEMESLMHEAVEEWMERHENEEPQDFGIGVMGIQTPPVRTSTLVSPLLVTPLPEIGTGESIEEMIKRERSNLMSRIHAPTAPTVGSTATSSIGERQNFPSIPPSLIITGSEEEPTAPNLEGRASNIDWDTIDLGVENIQKKKDRKGRWTSAARVKGCREASVQTDEVKGRSVEVQVEERKTEESGAQTELNFSVPMSQLFVEPTSFVVRTKATQVKEEIVGQRLTANMIFWQ